MNTMRYRADMQQARQGSPVLKVGVVMIKKYRTYVHIITDLKLAINIKCVY